MDTQATADAVHAARECLTGFRELGFSDADVEKLTAGITKGVSNFFEKHRDDEDTEFTLDQVLDTVDSHLRLVGLVTPETAPNHLDAIHEATACAVQSAVERLNS